MNIKDIIFVGSLNYYLNSIINITWEVTNQCNFNCYYCACKKEKSNNLKNKYNYYLNYIKKIQYNKLELCFTGGEFSIDPNFLPFLKELKNNIKPDVKLKFMTNLSNTKEYYDELLSIVYNYDVTFSTTYHNDPSNNIINYYNICEFLIKKYKNVFFDIRLPIANEFFKIAENNYNVLSSLNEYENVIVSPKYIVLDYVTLDLNQQNWFNDKISKLKNKNKNTFHTSIIYKENEEIKHMLVGREYLTKLYNSNIKWLCHTSKHSINIFSDGYIGYCQSTKDKTKYNIIDNNDINIIDKIKICNEQACGCAHLIPRINMINIRTFNSISHEWLVEQYNNFYN